MYFRATKKLNAEVFLDEPIGKNKDDNCITLQQVLQNDEGRKISFDQIAVIPYNEQLYCVLKPVDKIDGVSDDEAIVFVVHEEEGKEPVLMVETDEKTAIAVFDEYYNLLDEQDKDDNK